jgi:hypothetical protein
MDKLFIEANKAQIAIFAFYQNKYLQSDSKLKAHFVLGCLFIYL